MIGASIVLLALAYLPGAALAVAATAPTSRARWVLLAAAPVLTLGLAGAALAWTSALGWHWSTLDILAAELAAAVAALVARRLVGWRKRAGAGPLTARPALRPSDLRTRVRSWWSDRRGEALPLAGALAAGVSMGWWVVGRNPVPPGWDAMNHAFMTRRLLDLGSALPDAVCVTGSTRPAASCQFYPLAANLLWAQTTQLTGSPLSTVMLASMAVLAPVAAVVSVYAVVRRLGGSPLVAAGAGATVSLIGPIWQCLMSGLATVQLGAALSPAAALLVWEAVIRRRARAATLLTGVALGGMVVTHSYDALIGAVFGVGLLFTERIPLRPLLRWPLLVASVVGGMAVVLGPRPDLLFGAAGERQTHTPGPLQPGDLPGAVQRWLLAPGRFLATWTQPDLHAMNQATRNVGVVVLVLMVVGVLASVGRSRRWLRPFAVTQVVTMALVLFVDTSSSAARDWVAQFFYGDPFRVLSASIVAPAALAFGGAVAVAEAGYVAVRWVRTRPRPEAIVAPGALAEAGVLAVPEAPAPSRRASGLPRGARLAIPLASFALLCAAVLPLPATTAGPQALARYTPSDWTAYQQVGQWLAARLEPGQVVADDVHRDFVTWLNADYGVGVLDGLVPLSRSGHDDWIQRQVLWLDLTGTRHHHGCLDDPYGTRYVVVSDESMPNGYRRYVMSKVQRSPYLHLVLSDGPVHVYAVDDHCTGTGPLAASAVATS